MMTTFDPNREKKENMTYPVASANLLVPPTMATMGSIPSSTNVLSAYVPFINTKVSEFWSLLPSKAGTTKVPRDCTGDILVRD